MQTHAPAQARPSTALSPVACAHVGAVIALGVVILAFSTNSLMADGIGPLVVTLMVLTVVTGLAPLTIPKMPISFSISDTFSIVAALLSGPAAGALVAALDGLVPADRAGVEVGDVIVGFGGHEIGNPEDVAAATLELEPGTKVKLEVLRNGRHRDIEVALGTRPPPRPPRVRAGSFGW